ncbi:MAG: cbb3-type cytochrome oxidase assembly protein CcoS [Pseudomonadota bacterium]|nr:cbb3-type cytochrome oxidase assembly protein CcoS [Pseudomonadota bacterium]
MDVIYALIPMMLIFGFLVVVVFIWMAKTGQFDDLDGAANRIFMDDEFPEDRKSAKPEVKSSESSESANGKEESLSDKK